MSTARTPPDGIVARQSYDSARRLRRNATLRPRATGIPAVGTWQGRVNAGVTAAGSRRTACACRSGQSGRECWRNRRRPQRSGRPNGEHGNPRTKGASVARACLAITLRTETGAAEVGTVPERDGRTDTDAQSPRPLVACLRNRPPAATQRSSRPARSDQYWRACNKLTLDGSGPARHGIGSGCRSTRTRGSLLVIGIVQIDVS